MAEATIENLMDLYEVERGYRPADQARRVTVSDAVADARGTLLSLPMRLIQQLGLEKVDSYHICRGGARVPKYMPVRLTVMGRDCTMDVLEAPNGVPVQLGQVALGGLDLVIDPATGGLIENPAHGGEQVYEMY